VVLGKVSGGEVARWRGGENQRDPAALPHHLTTSPPNQIHVLEATARRVSAPDLVTLIDDCDRRWNPDVILFESNAAFLGIKDLLVRHPRLGPRVKGLCQSSDQGARVASFIVAVENGSFRLK